MKSVCEAVEIIAGEDTEHRQDDSSPDPSPVRTSGCGDSALE
jgi:hypothetical protein